MRTALETVTEGIVARFWSKVEKDANGCLLWNGLKGRFGYGIFTVLRSHRIAAHRFAWELGNGRIPDGFMACHRCDVPACVNPAHIFLGTAADNSHDMQQKGRSRNQHTGKTHCKHGHEFTETNTWHSTRGTRICRECARRRSATHKEKTA